MSDNYPPVSDSKPADASDVVALAEVHIRQIDTLEELDRHRENVDGAHLADIAHDAAIANFATRLSEELGARALGIARAQAERAQGEALRVWQAIVGQLERADD